MLGNLTLLTDKLNLKQSNQAWEDKRERLQRHSLLLLNKRLLEALPDAWDEAAIDTRSRVLAAAAAEVWPSPHDRRWQSVGPVNLDGLDLGASGAVELSEWQPSDGDLAAQLWMKIPRLAKRILAELAAHPDVSYDWEEIVRTVAHKWPKRVVPSVQRIQDLAAELGRESPVRKDREAAAEVYMVASSVAELFQPIAETPYALQLTRAGAAQLDFWTRFAAQAREAAPELPLRTPKPSPYMGFSLTAPDTWIRGVVRAMDEAGSFEVQELRACWMLGKRRADEYLLLLENQRQKLHEQLDFELAWPSASQRPPYRLCVQRTFDLYAPHTWEEPIDWMVRHLAALQGVAESALQDVSVEAQLSENELLLEEIADAFDRLDFGGAVSFGNARTYRQVRIGDWPGPKLHYEFSVMKRRFVELHIESKDYAFLAPVLEALVEEIERRFPNAECEFDPRWFDCGRLRLILGPDARPEEVAMIMCDFIRTTRDQVTNVLLRGE